MVHYHSKLDYRRIPRGEEAAVVAEEAVVAVAAIVIKKPVN
jgi:hypothetical protein